jgi:teichuronic acid exporter
MIAPQGGSIKGGALSGVVWNASELFVRMGLQFGITVALARLLTPEEFGIMALVSVFVAIAWIFTECGLSTAIVQQSNIEEAEVSSIFHVQWMLALITGVGLCLISPRIARFYGYASLEPLIWVMSLNLFMNALGAVPQALLRRALNFRPLMIAGSVSMLISGVLAVILASLGAGVWALAVQTLTATAINVAFLWGSYPWRPQAMFRPALLEKSLRFSGFLIFAGVLDAIYSPLYAFFVGKMYGAAELGQFNRAVATEGTPAGMITSIITRVAFPAFSAVQDEKRRLRTGLRKATLGTMALNIPVMLGLLAVAEPLVVNVFGVGW